MEHACRTWYSLPQTDKAWARFKTDFTIAHVNATAKATTGATGYQANLAKEVRGEFITLHDTQTALMEHQAWMAETNTNTTHTQHLADLADKITTMTRQMPNLQNNSRNNHGRNNSRNTNQSNRNNDSPN